jgi:hypothetical protein
VLERWDVEFANGDNGGGPVALRTGGDREIVAVHVDSLGHPMIAFPGSEASYRLVALANASSGAKRRTLGTFKTKGMLNVNVTTVDLEHDGIWEILVEQSAGYSDCDEKGGGSTSKWMLLDGDGRMLWADTERHSYSSQGSRNDDHTARVRVMDLWGDGRKALHFRADGTEWYVLPRGSELTTIPPCIE